jgi:hypothetical protein
MSNCLNCGDPLKHIEGRRPKKYCDNNCRQAYWQKNNKSKEPQYVKFSTFKELKDKFDELSKEVKIQDATKPTNIVKPFERPKTNYTINTIEETMPDGLHWKEQLEWKRNHKK